VARRKPGSRLRDFLLYVAISLGVVAAIILFAAHQAKTGQSAGLPLNWLGFAAMTALVFGDAIRITRRAWTQPRFWLLLGLAFIVQVTVGTLLLWNAPRMSTLVWAFFIPLDYAALGGYLSLFVKAGRSPDRVPGGPTSA